MTVLEVSHLVDAVTGRVRAEAAFPASGLGRGATPIAAAWCVRKVCARHLRTPRWSSRLGPPAPRRGKPAPPRSADADGGAYEDPHDSRHRFGNRSRRCAWDDYHGAAGTSRYGTGLATARSRRSEVGPSRPDHRGVRTYRGAPVVRVRRMRGAWRGGPGASRRSDSPETRAQRFTRIDFPPCDPPGRNHHRRHSAPDDRPRNCHLVDAVIGRVRAEAAFPASGLGRGGTVIASAWCARQVLTEGAHGRCSRKVLTQGAHARCARRVGFPH